MRGSRQVTQTSATCGNKWWPNYAKKTAKTSSVAGHRYGQVKFNWTTNSRLDKLQACANATFEPDWITYVSNGKYYFSRSIAAWASSLPRAYKDTTFSDSSGVWIYTIGTSDVDQLKPDKEYYTYFRSKKGNSGNETGNLDLQRGVRIPPWCHSTWCIFARATKPFGKTFMPGVATYYA